MDNGTRDGKLVIVSRDLTRAVSAAPLASTLQDALERWTDTAPKLQELYLQLQQGGKLEWFAFNAKQALAPLPRAWQWLDGSAFHSHGALMQKVFNTPPTPTDRPLMYQGVSDRFYSAYEDIPFPSSEDGIDFEAEFGVIVDEVRLGAKAAECAEHIRLLVQINDWSLCVLAPIEMKTGFGWVQAKPPCSVAPVAVTPDELGESWRDFRVCLPLEVDWNGKRFGAARGDEMGFGFDELVAHAARTRTLVAGTIIGSGTVSNTNFREVGSSCIAERRGIEIVDEGKPSTGFMAFGDKVRMEVRGMDGTPIFGPIEQQVVAALCSL